MSSNSSESDESYTSDDSHVNSREDCVILEVEDPEDDDDDQQDSRSTRRWTACGRLAFKI